MELERQELEALEAEQRRLQMEREAREKAELREKKRVAAVKNREVANKIRQMLRLPGHFAVLELKGGKPGNQKFLSSEKTTHLSMYGTAHIQAVLPTAVSSQSTVTFHVVPVPFRGVPEGAISYPPAVLRKGANRAETTRGRDKESRMGKRFKSMEDEALADLSTVARCVEDQDHAMAVLNRTFYTVQGFSIARNVVTDIVPEEAVTHYLAIDRGPTKRRLKQSVIKAKQAELLKAQQVQKLGGTSLHSASNTYTNTNTNTNRPGSAGSSYSKGSAQSGSGGQGNINDNKEEMLLLMQVGMQGCMHMDTFFSQND